MARLLTLIRQAKSETLRELSDMYCSNRIPTLYPNWIPNASKNVSELNRGNCFQNGDNVFIVKNRIAEFREAAGLSQAELAKHIGHQRSALQKIEAKPIENIKIGDLFALAHALAKHPWEIMGLEENLGIDNNKLLREEVSRLQRQLSNFGDNLAHLTQSHPAKRDRKSGDA